MLLVNDISFDVDNPRIRNALKKYGDQLNAERIHFALRSATDSSASVSSYSRLKDSILASKGIMTPVTVILRDTKYICIDGNTRLAIYKQFQKEGIEGPWTEIKATVVDDANQRDIETIRVSAHLVGARDWPAYEKAQYLHYLRYSKFMDYGEMIDLCGGNKKDIERQIDAYTDMNEFYRDVVDDTAFRIDRFSGFLELQKPGVKKAVFDAGLTLTDFGEWIRDGKIYRLEDVRDLPKVLRNDDAKKAFISGGPRSIELAVKLLDQQAEKETGQPTGKTTLEAASLHQLAHTLARRIHNLPYSELQMLRDRTRDDVIDQVAVLEDLSTRLQGLLDDVSK